MSVTLQDSQIVARQWSTKAYIKSGSFASYLMGVISYGRWRVKRASSLGPQQIEKNCYYVKSIVSMSHQPQKQTEDVFVKSLI